MRASVIIKKRRYEIVESNAFLNHFIDCQGAESVIDKIITPANDKLLKAGNSATVYLVEFERKEYVVKRYNQKNIKVWFKRQFVSRAGNSYRAAKLLHDAELKTPEAIALIRQKKGIFSGAEYLVSEKSGGQMLSDLSAEEVVERGIADKLNVIFSRLLSAKLSHGDMKATNLFVYDNDIVLIDLDSMRAHNDVCSAAKALSQDRERLLRNWPESEILPKLIEMPDVNL